jgi:alkyl hydroperoxide reductase subunit AhpF
MIKHTSLFLILIFSSLTLKAQTIKTGVLVVGNTPAGVSAAIQSARSGANTTYLTQSLSVNPTFAEEDLPYVRNIRNHYFLKERRKSKATDSIIALKINLDKATDLIKSIADTVKVTALFRYELKFAV